MNSCNLKTEGFHVNSEEKCNSFLNSDSIIKTEKDENWLGLGMYFWDNEGDANYWVKKKHKDGFKIVWIVKSIICTDNILNLTDNDILAGLFRAWTQYCNKSGETKNQGYGIVIDILYKIFYRERFDVIKGHGNYPNHKELFWIDYNNNLPHLTSKTKTIYCVKKENAIIKKKLHKKFTNYEQRRTIKNNSRLY